MKRTVCLWLAAAMLFALSACGGTTDSKQVQESTPLVAAYLFLMVVLLLDMVTTIWISIHRLAQLRTYFPIGECSGTSSPTASVCRTVLTILRILPIAPKTIRVQCPVVLPVLFTPATCGVQIVNRNSILANIFLQQEVLTDEKI